MCGSGFMAEVINTRGDGMFDSDQVPNNRLPAEAPGAALSSEMFLERYIAIICQLSPRQFGQCYMYIK